MQSHLITPHGETLVQLLAPLERRAALQAESRDWPSIDLDEEQLCDLELLINGSFSPLQGFLGRAEYDSVCSQMRLSNGLLWPDPVTLAIPAELAETLSRGSWLALRDPEGFLLAALEVADLWSADLHAEAQAIYGTDDPAHPAVAQLLRDEGKVYVGGRVEGLRLLAHYDFRWLRYTPDELRAEFVRSGWRRVLAFQTRQAVHRSQFETMLRAAKEAGANLLFQPIVGVAKAGDISHYTRVRCCEALVHHFPQNSARLALLPLKRRDGGPRDALRSALLCRNYGCSHLLVEDGAGSSAHLDILTAHAEELGIVPVPAAKMVYIDALDEYVSTEQIPEGTRPLEISSQELSSRLARDREIPAWFTFPEIAQELRRANPPRHSQGFTLFFTGLSGAGKSTIANVVAIKLMEMGGRPVTLLDGDIVRRNLSSQLGFSKEDRNINIRRIGFVASEITKNGGIAICAPIAPYADVRQEVRSVIEAGGGFVLVHVSTPLTICEGRDAKGLYAKARAGVIAAFTGISDPYEEPADADLAVDTSDITPEEAAQEVLLHLEREGYIGDPAKRG